MKTKLINASLEHYRAHVIKHKVNIDVLLENPTAIHEHSDIMEAIEKEAEAMAHYEDLIEVLLKFYPQETKDFNFHDYDY